MRDLKLSGSFCIEFVDLLYRFLEEKKNLYIGINVLILENGDCFICVIENSEGIGVVNFILIFKDRDILGLNLLFIIIWVF